MALGSLATNGLIHFMHAILSRMRSGASLMDSLRDE